MSRGGRGQGDNPEVKPHEVTRLGQLGKSELRGDPLGSAGIPKK